MSNKMKKMFNYFFANDEDETYEGEEELVEKEEETRNVLVKAENRDEQRKKFKINRFNDNARNEGSVGVMSSVSIIRPKVFEDARLIADSIKQRKVVSFSLEFLEFEVGQRVIDFVSGASYAMDAHLSKITDKVLICVPKGIDYEDVGISVDDKL